MNYNRDARRIINVSRDENLIRIHRCDHPRCVTGFIHCIKDAIRAGHRNIRIESIADAVFPNACVPITGIIDYFQDEGIEFDIQIYTESYLYNCGFGSASEFDQNIMNNGASPFDRIFSYSSSSQVANLTQYFIDTISHQCLCDEGVLNGLTWCINEVMDNVLVHSEYSHGLVMAQYHPTAKHVAFCIHDCGIGIHNTLKLSSHRPRTEIDALSMALQEGVGDGKGQGNGLFGLFQIVHDNKGRLSISSGSSSLMLSNDGDMKKFDRIPSISSRNRGTTIDFQINLDKDINIKKLFRSIGGFDGFDIRIDDMIDDNDCINYDVYQNGQGTATREAGAYIRNDVENILRRNETGVVLDFLGTQSVSSSFIDEFLAKMVLDLGFINFNRLIRIKGMNPDISYLCERSLYMRIHDTWKSTDRND